MPLKIPVKAGSVTNLTDARFFASYEVEYIGFCFDPLSPDYISPQDALAIMGWISGPQIVAEFANQDLDNVKNIISFLNPDVIEFNAHDSYFNTSNPSEGKPQLPVILNTSVHTLNKFTDKNYLYFLLYDYNGEDISEIKFPLMIDITGKKININFPGIKAIQVKGSAENETGVKNYDELAALLESLEVI